MTNVVPAGDRARYATALQNSYHVTAAKPLGALRKGSPPGWLLPGALNLLDASCALVKSDIALVSFGQYIGRATPPGIFTKRDRVNTTIIGDSGGYQFITGRNRFCGSATCAESLDWLETHTDVAMTLDIPSRAVGRNPQFPTPADAIETTLQNLAYFARHQSGKTQLLNVLQGRDSKEADEWYEAVKVHKFGGWAFGGPLRLDMYEMCRRAIHLISESRLGKDENWIHVLGTARLPMAVMLTALKRGLRDRVQEPSIEITFDTSSPFLMMSKYLGYVGDEFSAERFRLRQGKLPCGFEYLGSTKPFPFLDSVVGQCITLGDVCVRPHNHLKQSAWDEVSNAFIANHNVDRLLAGIEKANRLADLSHADRAPWMPQWLQRALKGIERTFAESTPQDMMTELKRWKTPLRTLVGTPPEEGEVEEERFGEGDQ